MPCLMPIGNIAPVGATCDELKAEGRVSFHHQEVQPFPSPDENEQSHHMDDMPSLHSSSSSSTLSDDEMILTPPTRNQELIDEQAVTSICLKSFINDPAWRKPAASHQPPAYFLVHKGQVIAYYDELDPARPYWKPQETWVGGEGRWKQPRGKDEFEFDVKGWCIAKERHDKAALAGEKTYTPRPRHFWRKLRIVNYLFWLSAFLAIAGYLFRLANLFADGFWIETRIALIYYFVVSTLIFSMGFP